MTIFAPLLPQLKNYFSSILFCFSVISGAFALDAPQIECITVNAAGHATVTWNQIPDPGGQFVSYELRRTANFGGVSQSVTTINSINTTSFTDVNADANNISVCYFLVTEFNNGSNQTTTGTTVCALNLIVTQSVPLGQAVILWNQPWQAPPAESDLFIYRLYMEYPVGTWAIISEGDYDQLSYFHEVTVCSEFLNFRIELEVPGSCNFVSNLEGDVFEDNTYPVTPVITTVEVDSTSNLASVQWLPSISPDTFGYIIYSCSGAQTLILDTLWGINSTAFVYPQSVAGISGNEGYLVAAFDSCFSGNPPTPNTSPTSNICHRSIWLDVSWFPCQTTVSLTWNPYNGWPGGIDFFEIWVQSNGNAPELLDTVSGTTFNYEHTNISDGTLYKYFVKAHALALPYTSLSNGVALNATSSFLPAYVYLSTATITSNQSSEVKIAMEATASLFTFYLERIRQNSDNVVSVDFKQEINVTDFNFIDSEIDAKTYSYTYQVSFENACGDIVGTTNVGKTILAKGIANSVLMSNTLTWSAYSDWDGGIREYVIHRSIDGAPFEIVGSTPPSQLFYQDDVFDLIFTKGEFCYIIEAIENQNSFGFSEGSKSNEICVTQEPKIWIPSAFTANGLNPVFKPVVRFADFDRYTLAIYDIWGSEIFRSDDLNIGWNGEVNGKMSKEGVYMYYMGVGNGNGALIERRGPVTLLVDGN